MPTRCQSTSNEQPWEPSRLLDTSKKGLPGLQLRIALHAGPVFCCRDPVTGYISYIGAHVSQAARIEPITPSGQVYVSQAFGALTAAEGIEEFRCEYVGRTPLAKDYRAFPTYILLRRLASGEAGLSVASMSQTNDAHLSSGRSKE